jgi:hypothetical protein
VSAPAKRGRKGPVPGKGGDGGKRKASILESVHEDSEGEENEEVSDLCIYMHVYTYSHHHNHCHYQYHHGDHNHPIS